MKDTMTSHLKSTKSFSEKTEYCQTCIQRSTLG